MNCHLDHASEVIELFHKRDFRCDCPTLKSNKCCFSEVVQVENRENKYQHNFEGLYCFCNKPYLESEEMIQCEICQDWFHDYCLKKEDTLYEGVDFSSHDNDFICKTCVQKYNFILAKYSQLKYQFKENSNEDIEITPISEEKRKCLIEGKAGEEAKNTFFVKKWRKLLCNCDICMKKYQLVGLDKIINEDLSFSSSFSEGEEEDLENGNKDDNLQLEDNEDFKKNTSKLNLRMLYFLIYDRRHY